MFFRRFAPSIFCIFFFFESLVAEEFYWENVAIKGGGFVPGLVFSDTVPGLLYARTDVGGAYRWNPYGHNWVPLNDELRGQDNVAFLYGVLTLAIDPVNPGNVYTANGCYLAEEDWNSDAVLISNNSGLTWKNSHLGRRVKFGGNMDGRGTAERMLVDPNKPDVLYLGTQAKGIYKSKNKGESWSRRRFPKDSVLWVLADKVSGGSGEETPVLYAFGGKFFSEKLSDGRETWHFTEGALYVSRNASDTWEEVSGIPENLNILQARIVGDFLYAALADGVGPNGFEHGCVMKLNMKTGEWFDLHAPNGEGGFSGLAVDKKNPNHIIVSTVGRWHPQNDVFRTVDGGKTWTSLFKHSDWDYASAPYVADKKPHWISDVEIDPFDSTRVLFTTGYGIFETQNVDAYQNGEYIKWSFMCDGLEETVPLDLVCPPIGASLHSAIGDIGGCRHLDIHKSPAKEDWCQEGGNAVSIAYAEQKPQIMVRSHWHEKRGSISYDAGKTWEFFKTAPNDASPGFVALSADGSSILYMSYKRDRKWMSEKEIKNLVDDDRPEYSKDYGKTWFPCEGLPGGNYHPVADPVLPNTFYVYRAKNGRIYRSDDGGATFRVTDKVKHDGGKMCVVPGKQGYLLIPHWSGLYISTNGGEDFDLLTSIDSAYEVAVGPSPVKGENPYIYCWGKKSNVEGIYLSKDFGESWTRINDNFHQFGYINTMAADKQNPGRVYLGTGGRGLIVGSVAKGYKAWQLQHFNALQMKEPLYSAHYSDPDSNGYDNYMEYAMAKDALSSGEPILKSSVVSGNTAEETFYTLEFLKPTEISIDRYQFQGSKDGSNWTELKVNPSWITVTSVRDGIDSVIFKIPATFDIQGSKSFRIYIPIKDRSL
jgi:hypothetical protein